MKEILVLLSDSYTFKIVMLGCSLLGILSAVVGTFAVLKKESLLGDGISHASLAGICLAFLITKQKETVFLLIGAFLIGICCVYLIHYIGIKSKVKFDSAIALILSTFFGLGLVLLTYLKKIPGAKKAGLNKFIFGQASTLVLKDIYLIIVVGVFLLSLVVIFWKELKVSLFDKNYAKTVGINSDAIRFLISAMITINVIIGIQITGVVLMTAMLVAPAVAARQWSNKLYIVVMLAAIFGGISGFIGTAISSIQVQLPTGPLIVLSLSIFVIISMLFAPRRGLIARSYRSYVRNKEIIRKYKEGDYNEF